MGERKEGREREEGRREGERESEREKGEREENNPVTFLLLRRSCLLFRMMKPTRHYKQLQQIHLAAQPMPHVQIFTVRHSILYTLVKWFSQQEHHSQTGHSLKGVRVAVLKAPGFGCSQSSVLFTVILGVLLVCVL